MIPIRDRLPTRRAPVVNWILILANVVVFLWERSTLLSGVSADRLLMHWGLVPRVLVADPIDAAHRIFTSMFMHDPSGWWHIGGNMLFLWVFGDNLEDALGHARYLAFYLLSGVCAALAQVFIDPFSMVPMVGASGAIAGVLAGYLTFYPRAPVTVLNPIPILWLFFGLFIELPAWVVILEFFVFNLINGFASLHVAASGGVAFFAHLGGFVGGLVLVRLFAKGARDGRADHDRWSGFRPPPRHPPPRYYTYYPPRSRWGS